MNGFIKRALATCLLSLFLVFCCYGEQSDIAALFTTRPNIEALNQNLDNLEQNYNQLLILNQSLRESLEQSQQSQMKLSDLLENQKIYSYNLEQQLQKSEHKSKIWSHIAIGSSCLFIASTTILIIYIGVNK